jgi:adenosylcobinamide-GDP ribazoletransferase
VRYAGRKESIISTLITVIITLGIFGFGGVMMFLAIVALTLSLGLFFKRRIGGVTGDIMGAACEVNEAAVLVLACALFL